MAKDIEKRSVRIGFTLVEVLVVIAIIGMLVALLLPAVMAAKTSAKKTVVKSDMTEIVNALENFKTSIGNGQYPPDGTNPADLQQFCKAAWPRVYWVTTTANYSATPPQVLYPKITPATALCFWLGGAQDAATNPHFIGFSANPANPFDYGASRTPVILEFDRTRVNPSPSGASKNVLTSNAASSTYYNLYEYYPPNGKDITSGANAPYVYYKAVPVPTSSTNTVYTTKLGISPANPQQQWPWQPTETYLLKPQSVTILSCQPYTDSTSTTNPKAFVNPQSFQLLCPGLDGIYGSTTDDLSPQYPSGSNYNQNTGVDDMTNFTQGPTVGNDVK